MRVVFDSAQMSPLGVCIEMIAINCVNTWDLDEN